MSCNDKEIEINGVKYVRATTPDKQALDAQQDRYGHRYQIGQGYFIRTVTHHLTGRLIAVTQQELVLEDAAWIADNGRYNEFLRTGSAKEVEPYPDGEVCVGRGSIIDVCLFPHKLPREVK